MNPFFKTDSVVLFYGDSITDASRVREVPDHLGNGYPAKIAAQYRMLFPNDNVSFLNRGVSGDTSADLLRRYNRDVLAYKPDFISILIGINDTWHGWVEGAPVSEQTFEKNVHTLLEKLRCDLPDTKMMLMVPYLLSSDPQKASWHADFDPKAEVIRRLIGEYADYAIDLPLLFARQMEQGIPAEIISEDGVHPLDYGHSLIAEAYLKTLGIR